MKVYVLDRGLGDSPNDPQSEIVGIYSTADQAWTTAHVHAPRSGNVSEFEVNGEPFSEKINEENLLGRSATVVADMVRRKRAAMLPKPGPMFDGRPLDLRVDDAIRLVAAELGVDWRPVLRAYRAKYPVRGVANER